MFWHLKRHFSRLVRFFFAIQIRNELSDMCFLFTLMPQTVWPSGALFGFATKPQLWFSATLFLFLQDVLVSKNRENQGLPHILLDESHAFCWKPMFQSSSLFFANPFGDNPMNESTQPTPCRCLDLGIRIFDSLLLGVTCLLVKTERSTFQKGNILWLELWEQRYWGTAIGTADAGRSDCEFPDPINGWTAILLSPGFLFCKIMGNFFLLLWNLPDSCGFFNVLCFWNGWTNVFFSCRCCRWVTNGPNKVPLKQPGWWLIESFMKLVGLGLL